ncbi:MAG: adenylosuccinate synthase [Saprospiraceae bacterium]|nr:adenylosuccinate synthase [Saprospiraceae bacterium]
MAVDVILGLQWGDEGKGKIVDYLSENYHMVCRFQGGPNAGHTIKIGDNKYVLHTIPSGVFRQNIINLVGNGVVIDPITFMKELDKLDEAKIPYRDRLFIANKAHLILPTHRLLDAASEASKGKAKIGSTLKGIGPTYMDKTGRNGLRVGDINSEHFKSRYNQLREKHLSLLKLYPQVDFDLEGEEAKWFAAIEQLRSLNFVNGEYMVNEAIAQGKKILAEGAQGSMLDIDFGTYPFVTSSNTVTSGVCNGLGIAPSKIGRVFGITKAYCTRVGSGPFPTELFDDNGEKLRRIGQEFGATTGRPRRCGWIDLPQLKYTIMINGVTDIVITKLDVLDDFESINYCDSYDIKGEATDHLPFDLCVEEVNPQYTEIQGWNTSLDEVTEYQQLPEKAKAYITTLEEKLETKITMISTGPERRKILIK